MTDEPNLPLVFDLIEAFRRSKAMFTAVRLGIFDMLETGPMKADALAGNLKLHPAALRRLLDALVSLELLARKGDCYINSSTASRYLVRTARDTFAGYIEYSDESLYHLWSHLDDAVRNGTNRWSQTFGSRDVLFEYYYRDEQTTANFVRAMNGFGRVTSPAVVRAFDLSPFQRLIDLGGGTGHLAIAACQLHPRLHATVVDLPRLERFAREQIEANGLRDRIEFTTADFFKDQLPAGDLYALGRILHDWNREDIYFLLEKIANTLPAHGGLLIAEALLADDHTGPLHATMQDLNMLVCTEGRERCAAEYKVLLEAAGFSQVRSARTGTPLDAVLAIKA